MSSCLVLAKHVIMHELHQAISHQATCCLLQTIVIYVCHSWQVFFINVPPMSLFSKELVHFVFQSWFHQVSCLEESYPFHAHFVDDVCFKFFLPSLYATHMMQRTSFLHMLCNTKVLSCMQLGQFTNEWLDNKNLSKSKASFLSHISCLLATLLLG